MPGSWDGGNVIATTMRDKENETVERRSYLMDVNTPHITQLRIGHPKNHADPGEDPWITSIFREPVNGAIYCTKLGFEGDQVGDPSVHGGPDKAVLCYATSNYPKWREQLALPMECGGFGENLCIEGLDESSVCIGDVYRMGEAEVEVSQPRGPCGTLARRWGRLDLPRRVIENHRSGWYIRVLKEGKIAPGDRVELLARPQPEWTVARTAEVNYSRDRSIEDLRELSELPELSNNWKRGLREKLEAAVEKPASSLQLE